MSAQASPAAASTLLANLDHLNAQQLRRLLVDQLTRQKVGLYWEASAIERDAALHTFWGEIGKNLNFSICKPI